MKKKKLQKFISSALCVVLILAMLASTFLPIIMQ